jgi:glucan phosphoethanolaminetransferase (alkaline phosphatase superfamily)
MSLAKRFMLLIPLVGCCLFILLYIIAAFLYPGGSDADEHSTGFSILHNYWCELLNARSRNGVYNPGSPVAMWAMGVLCFSLAIFWWIVPRLFVPNPWYKILIAYAGIISMLITPFISSQHHDLVINLASIFGVIALLATFTALYKGGWYKLLALGIFCLLLIGLNNYIYYTGQDLHTLPVLQKVTFLLVMTWMGIITWLIYQRNEFYSNR